MSDCVYIGSETADICSAVRRIADRTAFIVSPRYPQRYPPDSECVCSVVTERNQRMLVRVAADSVLQSTSNCLSDVLVIYDDSERTLARCGHLRAGLNVTSRTHAILVAFRTDHRQQYKGFWLAVEGCHCSVFTRELYVCRQRLRPCRPPS